MRDSGCVAVDFFARYPIRRVMPNGGALDVDVTTGYGPEIFSSAAPLSGNYHIYVNYYGSGQDASALTVAQVSIITNENTPREKQQSFQVPMRTPGELTLVKSSVVPCRRSGHASILPWAIPMDSVAQRRALLRWLAGAPRHREQPAPRGSPP